jgi:hypothetical protein
VGHRRRTAGSGESIYAMQCKILKKPSSLGKVDTALIEGPGEMSDMVENS